MKDFHRQQGKCKFQITKFLIKHSNLSNAKNKKIKHKNKNKNAIFKTQFYRS